MSNPFDGFDPEDVPRMVAELWLPGNAEKTIGPNGNEVFIIRPEFNPDDVHDAVWSPFDDAGELRTEELAAEGWVITGAIKVKKNERTHHEHHQPDQRGAQRSSDHAGRNGRG